MELKQKRVEDPSESDQLAALYAFDAGLHVKKRKQRENKQRRKKMKVFELDAKSSSVCFLMHVYMIYQ